MGFHFRIYNNERPYFVTTTVVQWIKLFSMDSTSQIIVDSLKFCQKNKGLEIYAWCLMPSHIHLIVRASEGFALSSEIRDFKTYTSKKIIQLLKNDPENNNRELLRKLNVSGINHAKSNIYKVWQDGYHPIELYTPKFTKQKLDYIHNNPVVGGLVENSWDCMYSSARNYFDKKYLIELSEKF